MKRKVDLTQLRNRLNDSSMFTAVKAYWTLDHDVFQMNVDFPKESDYRYLTVSVVKPEEEKWHAFPVSVELHTEEPRLVTDDNFKEEASEYVFKGAPVNLYCLGVVIGFMNLGIGVTADNFH